MSRIYEQPSMTPDDTAVFAIEKGADNNWTTYKTTWGSLKTLLSAATDIQYNAETGVFTFTKTDGNVITITPHDPTKVDKVAGKGLSENDFTNTLKTKLDNIAAGAEANVQSDWNQTNNEADDYIKNKPTIPTVDAALDATSENAIQNKAVKEALDDKVDAVEGKGLSTEDYTAAEKTKLAGVEAGANNYVLPPATASTLGGVKPGINMSVDANGVLSMASTDIVSATEAWLDDHIDPTTGYAVDNTLEVTGAAADAKTAGDKISEIKSALDYLKNETGLYEVTIPYTKESGYQYLPFTIESGTYLFSNISDGQGTAVAAELLREDNTRVLAIPVDSVNMELTISAQDALDIKKIVTKATTFTCVPKETIINTIVSSQNDIEQLERTVENIIDGSVYTQIEPEFINGRGYTYSAIGVNPSNAFTNRADRATAFVDISIGSKITFDGTICGVNYYVVNYRNEHELEYTPDTWDYSGNITINVSKTYKYLPKTSVVIVVRKPDNSNISNSDLESIIASFTVENNNEVYPMTNADVIIFAGQSNIAGRGVTNSSHPEGIPNVKYGTAFEFKAITDPSCLYPLSSTFGIYENKTGYIDDGSGKSGSLVPAFANSYFPVSDIPIVCVSASQGGTSISDWKNNKVTDAVQRFEDCVTYLTENNINIRHKYVVWCQGETDGDLGTSKTDYIADFDAVMTAFKNVGIEQCLLIRIGNCNASEATDRYTNMIAWQTEIAQTDKFVTMISCVFAGMRDRGMMKDNFHYYQDGYNECGNYAGVNAGIYASTAKEQVMYDPENNSLYYSHKN